MRRTPLPLLALPLALLATAPVRAQPEVLPPAAVARPDEAARAAGRQALAAAAGQRWVEAGALALAADPLVVKLVEWQRLQVRGTAGAPAITAFAEANPDWPAQETLARRAEEALAADPDDALALRWFARSPPRTPEGAARHADALARAGREAAAGLQAAGLARAAWNARQIEARRALREGDAPGAYALAAGHGIPQSGEPRQEAEFLAGFLALRRLNDPGLAAAHFARVGEGSRSVITRARAAYWQGRAAEAAGGAAEARARWAEAAALPVAFYGQLASLALGEPPARLAGRIRAVPQPAADPERARRFAGRELTRAAAVLAELGEVRRARAFLLRLEELAPDGTDRLFAARLGRAMGRPDYGVWVARRAGASGTVLLAEGWPTPYPVPVASPEPALIHAIARQESNFDPEAVSSSNARGLMQLLPGTAQQVARRLGLAHANPMLTQDPAHNIRLGAGYLDEMLERFGGAVPLAAAAYNAGPRRVDEWLAAHGDPRAEGGPSMLDWMEAIPFAETRNYVQRVVENVAVYRALDPAAAGLAHPMARWLAPASPPAAPAAAPSAPAGAPR